MPVGLLLLCIGSVVGQAAGAEADNGCQPFGTELLLHHHRVVQRPCSCGCRQRVSASSARSSSSGRGWHAASPASPPHGGGRIILAVLVLMKSAPAAMAMSLARHAPCSGASGLAGLEDAPSSALRHRASLMPASHRRQVIVAVWKRPRLIVIVSSAPSLGDFGVGVFHVSVALGLGKAVETSHLHAIYRPTPSSPPSPGRGTHRPRQRWQTGQTVVRVTSPERTSPDLLAACRPRQVAFRSMYSGPASCHTFVSFLRCCGS